MFAAIDTLEQILDLACDWLTAHPRITCALICAIGMIPLVMAEMTTWGEI